MVQVKSFAVVAVATVLTFGLSVTSSADEVSLERLEQYRKMLDEQVEKDERGAVDDDIQVAKTWLKEAEVLLAQGEETLAKSRLRRVEFGIDLVRQLVQVVQMKHAADDQESAAYKAPQTIQELEQETKDLELARTKLKADLDSLRGAVQ
jgi:hypothetical protein